MPGRLIIVPIFCLCLLNASCSRNEIRIISCILRDRVVVLDAVRMKKALYVAFSQKVIRKDTRPATVTGQLFVDSTLLTESVIKRFSEQNGNLVFDLPYQIPDGRYTIRIAIAGQDGAVLGQAALSTDRWELRSSLHAEQTTQPSHYTEMQTVPESVAYEPDESAKLCGLVLFSRSPLEYVFPHSRPRPEELVDRLKVRVVRNEYEPITFSILAFQNLGVVEISVDGLRGRAGSLPPQNIRIAHVETVQDTAGLPAGRFRNLPRLIRPGGRVKIAAGSSQRFWLTLRVEKGVSPGSYAGTIHIAPANGKALLLPLDVEVVPITLEDIPGVDYFMLMTYEFTELTMPWGDKDNDLIYQAGLNILKDYKAHGMTTVCPHSPFVFKTNDDGSPDLDDIFATLRAARDAGFTRPIIWYMGHLIQTAKPKHPGNIVGFDEKVHLRRLKELIKKVTRYSRDNNCPKVIFMPIDEYDDTYQDYLGKRLFNTPLLLKTIKKAGANSMVTASRLDPSQPINYFCSSKFNTEDANIALAEGISYLLYNNKVTTTCRNPAYARYIYGLYTWQNNLNGMTSWTFQNTQNASGWPTLADSTGKDIYLAYPDPSGPLSTPEWEATREGIDDRKLIYQLEKRLELIQKRGIDTSKYNFPLERDIRTIKEPDWQFDDSYKEKSFQNTREELISMILEIDSKFPLEEKKLHHND